MAEISDAEKLLLEILGVRFLAFVLNADEASISRRLQDGQRLTSKRESVLAELIAFLGTLSTQQPPNRFLLSFSLGALGQTQQPSGLGWATARRIEAGGDIDLPQQKEPIDSALLAMVRDTYPLFLLPRQSDEWSSIAAAPLAQVVFNHPQREVFENTVMADEVIASLFPAETKEAGRMGSVYRSTGSAGSVQLWMLSQLLLKNGWQYATHSGLHPTMRTFAKAVLDQLALLRRAVQGKPVEILALVGIAGLKLPGAGALTLPWGRLRPVKEKDQQYIPPGLSGQLTTTTSDGSQVVIDYAGDLVLEMKVPYKIKVGDLDAQLGADWPLDLVSAEIVGRRLESLRLALLLSSERTPLPMAHSTWRVFLEPLGHGMTSSWSDPRQAPSLVPSALTAAERDNWRDWVRDVDAQRVPNIDVAVRRTLMAAAERPDPTDALVDAVIAWENLVGSREGEPTLRVSAALAWLLGKNAVDRIEIRRQVLRLYKLRSDVVHGNRFLNPREAGERHREALGIAVRALRVLLRERLNLLTDCKDGNERSLQLILDG